MTGIRSDSRGQVTFDFLLGLVIFLMALIYVAASIPGIFLPYQNNAVDLSSVAYRTSSLLVEDPGYYIPSGGYGRPDWEKSQQNINDLSRIGLASSKSTPGVLSLQKIIALRDNVSYLSSRDDLGLNNTVPYDYSLSITWTNRSGNTITMTKPNATEPAIPVGSNVETIERIILVDEGSGILVNGEEEHHNTTDDLVEKLAFNVTKDQAMSGDIYINILNSSHGGSIDIVYLYGDPTKALALNTSHTPDGDYDVYINGTKWDGYGSPIVNQRADISIIIKGSSIVDRMLGPEKEVDVWVWTTMPMFSMTWNNLRYPYDDSNPRYWSVYDKGVLSLKVWS